MRNGYNVKGYIVTTETTRSGRKISVDNEGPTVSVTGPFGWDEDSKGRVKRPWPESVRQMLRSCGRGGHNNIKSNPVFRGMVCPERGRTDNQRKMC
jgi:hypothetical protein